MSTNADDLSALVLFGKVRRQLNLLATAELRPFGIGPKQAVILREIQSRKAASLSDLSRQTHTDPASTGKIVESLIRKHWVKRTEDPEDRRRSLVSLTEKGQQAAQRLESVYRSVAKKFCAPLAARDKEAFIRNLSELSSNLEKS